MPARNGRRRFPAPEVQTHAESSERAARRKGYPLWWRKWSGSHRFPPIPHRSPPSHFWERLIHVCMHSPQRVSVEHREPDHPVHRPAPARGGRQPYPPFTLALPSLPGAGAPAAPRRRAPKLPDRTPLGRRGAFGATEWYPFDPAESVGEQRRVRWSFVDGAHWDPPESSRIHSNPPKSTGIPRNSMEFGPFPPP